MRHRHLQHLAHRVLIGERGVGLLHPEPHRAGDEAEPAVPHQRAGKQPGLAQNLEPVADAQDRAAFPREALHRGHDRAESGDGAGAQVVAVAEAAGQHHHVGALQVGVAMPDEVGLRTRGCRRPERVDVAVAAGEPDDRDSAHQASTSTR